MELIKLVEHRAVSVRIWPSFPVSEENAHTIMEVNVHFLNGNSPAMQQYYAHKNYRDDVIIQINKLFYEVYFYTEASMDKEIGEKGFFSLPGLIMLNEINNNEIYSAIDGLIELGYFDCFKGKTEFPIKNRFADKWYEGEEHSFDFKESGPHRPI
ncbi:MAG: hypothetical protein V4590_06410 [Bacteroidota bacterium]